MVGGAAVAGEVGAEVEDGAPVKPGSLVVGCVDTSGSSVQLPDPLPEKG